MNKKALCSLIAITALSTLAVNAKTSSISQRLPQTSGSQAPSANDFSYITLAKPGEKVDVRQAVVKGKYTIVDFQSKYCPDCLKMKPLLMNLAKVRPDIAVRMVDINRAGFKGIDWKSPVAAQYQIRDIPQFKLFGPNGALIGQGDAAMNQVLACLSKDLPAVKKQH